MGYEIKTLEDSLSGHVFEINGAIALKNYTAQVDGDRITITSANNSALSILECDVSEVDIDGVVYDNAVDAQNALRSIIYNDLPIVVLNAEEKKKLLLKVDENHPDAKKLFSCDGSVFEFSEINHKLYTTNSFNTSDLLQGLSQNGRHTIIRNEANDLNVIIDNEITSTYLKTGTGSITFSSKMQLVMVDSTNKLNGKIGSTATVSVDDGKAFLRISNV